MNTSLTEREHHVMSLICMGKSNALIAKELDVSVNTIKTHLRNVYKKLDVDNRTQASMLYRDLERT